MRMILMLAGTSLLEIVLRSSCLYYLLDSSRQSQRYRDIDSWADGHRPARALDEVVRPKTAVIPNVLRSPLTGSLIQTAVTERRSEGAPRSTTSRPPQPLSRWSRPSA